MSHGFVYVMSRPGGAHKIGLSIHPKLRRQDFGRTVRLEHSVEHPGADDVERIAHKLLKDRRLDGEWFAVRTEEAVAAVNRSAALVDAGDLSLIARRSRPRYPSLGEVLQQAIAEHGLATVQFMVGQWFPPAKAVGFKSKASLRRYLPEIMPAPERLDAE